MSKKENVLISACFLGLNCRYDEGAVQLSYIEELMLEYHLVPICPEIMGGMGTPRSPAEIIDEKVISNMGHDVTKHYEVGAREALKLARLYKCRYAILKEHSPSCGYGRIYDGSFSGTLVEGNGVTAGLLAENGLTIIGESHIRKLFKPQ